MRLAGGGGVADGFAGFCGFNGICLPLPPVGLAGELIEACVVARRSPVRGQSLSLYEQGG
jgi:hypothetical protein